MNSNIALINWNTYRHLRTIPICSWLGTIRSVTPINSTALLHTVAEHTNIFSSTETADDALLKERRHVGVDFVCVRVCEVCVCVCDFS